MLSGGLEPICEQFGSGKSVRTSVKMVGIREFPAGLRVMIVDDDQTCLKILEKMLNRCFYEVTKCSRAEEALSRLREHKNGYDIVLSDVHMPDMDGFKLLEYIGLEMDLPVLMMSADDSKSVVMKGVVHGAVDYLIKPLRMDALKNIWQHVVRRKMNEWKDLEQSGSAEEGEKHLKSTDEGDNSSSGNECSWRSSRKRKEEEDDETEDKDDNSTLKKPRVVWSVDLHQQFVAAVNQLGIDKAVPKKILELMNIPGLTRENVASHLQKYRLYLKRVSGVSQNPNNSFIGSQDIPFGALSSLSCIDLQPQVQPHTIPALSGFGRSSSKARLPLSVADQRGLFSFEKQPNLLHGVSMNTDSKLLSGFHHPGQSLGDPAGSSTFLNVSRLPNPIAEPFFSGLDENIRATRYPSQESSLLAFSLSNPFELSGNASPLISGLKLPFQEDIPMNLKPDGGFPPTYDAFSDLQKSVNWDFQNIGLNNGIFRPNYAANQDFPLSNHIGNRLTGGVTRPLLSFQDATVSGNIMDSSLSDCFVKIKTENSMCHEQLNQDLLNAVFKQHQGGVGASESDLDLENCNVPV